MQKNDLEVLVGTKLNMSQQYALAAKKVKIFSATLSNVLLAGQGDLLSTGEPTPGKLCPVLGYPIQERHGHNGKRPL